MPPQPDKNHDPLVLIVEDDPTILRGLKDSFEFEGYRTRASVDGKLALNLAIDLSPDLILLDIMLPGMNGFEICKSLRDQARDTPIIMLTAKSREEDVVLGLNLGADDYMTKPFRIAELHARARRLLTRRHCDEPASLNFGPYELCVTERTLRHGPNTIELQPKEFDLLVFFARRPHRAITRDQILDAVWDSDSAVADRNVDRCVRGLRKKIESDPRNPKWIKTVHRVGYRFESD